MDNKLLVQELVKQNLLASEVGEKLLAEALLIRRGAEDLIHEKRLVNEEDVSKIKSGLLNVPYKKIQVEEIKDEVLKIIPEETVRNYKVIPISLENDLLTVGMINPVDAKAQEALRFIAKQRRVNLGSGFKKIFALFQRN